MDEPVPVCGSCEVGLVNGDWTMLDQYEDGSERFDRAMAKVELLGLGDFYVDVEEACFVCGEK